MIKLKIIGWEATGYSTCETGMVTLEVEVELYKEELAEKKDQLSGFEVSMVRHNISNIEGAIEVIKTEGNDKKLCDAVTENIKKYISFIRDILFADLAKRETDSNPGQIILEEE